MDKMKVLDLFSGIGGFSLGLERAGMETVAFCEFDKHAQKVLKKHWPDVPIHEDVRTLDGKQFRGTVNVICGGFPCQDVSQAGNKVGVAGSRTNLYTEMLRVISECLPKYAIFENVTGLLSGDNGRWFARFLYDLAQIGYDAEWHCISASYIGAPHHRDRVWIIAYPNGNGRPKVALQNISSNGGEAEKRWASINAGPLVGNGSWQDWEKQSGVQLVVDGVPGMAHACKQLGNSVVPQIPEIIGRAIIDCEMSNG